MTDPVDAEAREQLDRARGRWAVVLNAVAPGSGLVVLRLDRLGVAVGGVFMLLSLTGLWGLWIAPGVVPRPLAFACLGMGAVVWCAAQWLVWRRRGVVLGEPCRTHVGACCARADQAVEARRFAEAEAALLEAIRWDDEDPSTWVQWARLLVVMGRVEDARDAWEAALDVDKSGAFRREAIMALERLPSNDPLHDVSEGSSKDRMDPGRTTTRK